jgi:hypothetical protein
MNINNVILEIGIKTLDEHKISTQMKFINNITYN